MAESLFAHIWNYFHPSTSVKPDPNAAVTNNVPTLIVRSLPQPIGVTAELLEQLSPNLVLVEDWMSAINTSMAKYGIGLDDLPMFLAQTLYESSYYTQLEENLYYTTVGALVRAFGVRVGPDPSVYLKNPAKLANHVYANRYGNGDEASGDGYLNRGRGPIMYTFYANYLELSQHFELTVAATRAYILTPLGAIQSAMHFWQKHNLTRFKTADDVKACTLVINGGSNGIAGRQKLYADIDSQI